MSITREQLEKVALSYPQNMRSSVLLDIERQFFQVNLLAGLAPGGTVADIGGGFSMLTPALTEAGLSAILIDDFNDATHQAYGDDVLRAHRERGVRIEARDVIADGLGQETESLDVAISVDSMEHFHHSPKQLFHDILAGLKPGGWFIIGVPNSVNLRKRVTVPLGKGNWSHMADWYEPPVFRGHVREPDVGDLRYVADDLGLVEVSVIGRNWQGYLNSRPWVRKVTPHADRFLQKLPTLCSDLYLMGRKPQRS